MITYIRSRSVHAKDAKGAKEVQEGQEGQKQFFGKGQNLFAHKDTKTTKKCESWLNAEDFVGVGLVGRTEVGEVGYGCC